MNEKFSQLWVMVQQDRKKATTLAILLVVAVAMGLRALVSGGGGGPSRASAAPTARSSPSAAKPGPAPTMDQALAALRPQTRLSTMGAPPRDLFHSTWAVIGSTDGEASGKSGAGLADNGKGPWAEDPRARVEAEAEKLRLRSTLLGANPLAVIERSEGGEAKRRVARPGEQIDGFRVVRIEAHLVELEKDGVRIVLEQERPAP
mgnify:CR=1 FL=1